MPYPPRFHGFSSIKAFRYFDLHLVQNSLRSLHALLLSEFLSSCLGLGLRTFLHHPGIGTVSQD